jgi:flagellar secretion chaperone FliS
MSSYAMRAYSATAVRTTVDDANPHQLILMLYDGVLRHVRMARMHMVRGEIGPKAQSITSAIDIIAQGLRLSLDPERGGEIAANLNALYDFCEQRLVQANARNEVAMLDDVLGVLEPLHTGWQGIAPAAAQPAAVR